MSDGYQWVWQWRAIAIACLGLTGAPLLAPQETVWAQPQPICVEEIRTYQRGAVSERMLRGREALRRGQLETAATRLAAALNQIGAIADQRLKAELLQESINDNSVDAGWLREASDRFRAEGKPELADVILTAALRATQSLNPGYSFAKTRLLATIGAKYGAMGGVEPATDILDQALQAEAYIRGAEFKAKALTEIARGYLAAKLPFATVEVLNRAVQQAETVTYPSALRRAFVMEPIATTYAQAGAVDRALEIAQSIQEPYYRDNAIASAVVELTRGGQVDRAASLLPRITTTQVKAQALGQMGVELVRRGNPDAARTYLIQAAMTASDTVYPPLELARTLAAEGEPDLALAMLSALSDGEYKARGLNELAVSYAQAGDAATTREVLRQALQAADAIPEDYRRAEMVQEIFQQAIALEAYEVAFEIRENQAYNAFDPFEDYTAIAIAAAHSGQFEAAQKALAKIDPSYIGYADRARFAIAVAYAETGQFEEALATTKAMNQSYARYIHALAAIAVRYQQAGKTEDAAATLARAEQEIDNLFTPEEPVAAFNAIALEYAKAEQPERAAAFFARAIDAANAFPEGYSNFSALALAAQAWMEIGEYERSLQLIQTIDDDTQKSSALQNLVDRLMQEEQYALVLAITETYEDPGYKAFQMMRVADLYHQMGQTDRALTVLARAYEVARTIPGDESKFITVREDLIVEDTLDRGSLYEEIALTYARLGAKERGLTVVRSLQDAANRDRASQRLDCYR